ncbi:MAG: ribonuclease domain-containing protein [Scytonema sp. PMC 1069.18]|nr:ribonuclease domain-containing protein [Scytonema sp. PMC 1069.18]MEC4884559.1 ribonuclease domain-containing protein [Scytonema sp. PMC 1070.18]
MTGIPQITINKLPPEVQITINLISQGGPFPHPKDGSVFKNLELLLPPQPIGYYREYTVKTPGAIDRGSRRLIIGQNGEMYYTANHYNSFQEVIYKP